MDRTIDAVDSVVTLEMHDQLTKPYTEGELVTALSQMYLTKSPGPDGCLITDNVLTAYEISHQMDYSGAKTKGSFAFKLDMSKAYDRVKWIFLKRILLRMGFGLDFASLIVKCISTVSISLLLNGHPGDRFKPSRGLR